MLRDANKTKALITALRRAAKLGNDVRFRYDHEFPNNVVLGQQGNVIVLNTNSLYREPRTRKGKEKNNAENTRTQADA